ncbi:MULTISPECIES: LPS export ABC transporter permease LptG [unclassified Methylobacterium]|uniref:LPS export ABC transporter permease LptG n=1 Tax=unclassified Methylobacterium TaxID=2615210 RepID=UPI0006F9B7E8|nr:MULTISPECIES: LPS export ABC transporter permease LptG [unclassified Methylobacterium]KQO66888.1 LPS export ABC transporter permease LptG [Methylobacterium sp. Leaf89]KQO74558.1 LPS export ABC transporter permease LptG [Methylobacterium sp. Leaf88]KQP62418.1 LPS export ABC transporter permease LptG [Methylobacterium sp. Leaf111]KQT84921.1 LPS export ABC transporter permease LptG [Methylobacterium sp. Leaf465]KQU21184.1 LPS export ABC transporter permease LptG [Methylobacterium sp. Leaf94]
MLIGATLGRYFAMRFVRTILGVFLTVFTLVYTLDFVELLRRAGDAEGASTGLMAQLSLYRTPAVAEGVLPFAILFGSMAALLQLSRKLELVVARAAGISAWQFLQPGVFVALAIGAFTVGVYNPISALMKQRSTEIEAKIFARSTKANSGKDLWIRQRSLDGQAIIRADTAVEGTTTLAGVSVFAFDEAGIFTAQIEAAKASLHDGYWELSQARVMAKGQPAETFDTYLIASTLVPSQVRQRFTPPESVPFWQLPETISRSERAGLDATRYRLQYDVLLARPVLFLAMVLVAASVSLRFFRFGGVGKLVLSGVAAGFVLYVARQVLEGLGASGIVTPAVAAWFPAVVGSLLGTLTLLYQEDG